MNCLRIFGHQMVIKQLVLAVLMMGARCTGGPAFAADERPAASLKDLKQHFATCFRPPAEATSSRPTFYFSLTKAGKVVAKPRIIWFESKGSSDERKRVLSEFESGFAGCLPLKLNSKLALTLPGEVYFLQYVVGLDGETSAVIFRPFGSHGGGGYAPLPLEPEDGFVPSSPGIVLRELPRPNASFRRLRPPTFFLRPRVRGDKHK